jgi:hypothetical protein
MTDFLIGFAMCWVAFSIGFVVGAYWRSLFPARRDSGPS